MNLNFYSVAEAARLLRVSQKTLRRLIHSGEVPAVKVGRNYRISNKILENAAHSGLFREDDR